MPQSLEDIGELDKDIGELDKIAQQLATLSEMLLLYNPEELRKILTRQNAPGKQEEKKQASLHESQGDPLQVCAKVSERQLELVLQAKKISYLLTTVKHFKLQLPKVTPRESTARKSDDNNVKIIVASIKQVVAHIRKETNTNQATAAATATLPTVGCKNIRDPAQIDVAVTGTTAPTAKGSTYQSGNADHKQPPRCCLWWCCAKQLPTTTDHAKTTCLTQT